MRLWFIIAVLVLGGGFAIFRLASYNPQGHHELVDLAGIATWEPTTEQIRSQIQATEPLQKQKKQYTELFRSRYRRQNMAVNLRVDTDGVFYLECAATIPTWDKALIAGQAWQEVKELFGGEPQVLIYESYIGIPSRRVGIARSNGKQPSALEIVFDTGWHLRRKPQANDFLITVRQGG